MLIGYLSVAFVSLLISLIFNKFIIKISHKKGWFDYPDERTLHKILTPRLGGVGIFWSLLLALVIISFFVGYAPHRLGRHLLILAAVFSVHLTGLVDDFRDLKAWFKLILQIVSALFVVLAGYQISHIPLPFTELTVPLGEWGPVLTVIWIVSMANAMNLIDGMDGLAAGIASFAVLSLGAYYAAHGEAFPALLAFSTLGALMGFLWFNKPRAKLFMGDSGSLVLGFLMAILPLMGQKTTLVSQSLLLPLSLMLIPISDTLGAMIRRLRDRRKIFAPDSEHIHNKMLKMGLSTWKILIFVYGLSLILSVPTLLASLIPAFGAELMTGAELFSMGNGVLIILFFSWLHFAYKKIRRRSSPQA